MKSIQFLFSVFLCVALSSHRVAAEVPDHGFNSLFIGHSFFKPFADGMPNYTGAAGIPGHSQSVVFSGGATGAPLALWNNASKSAQIKAYLDSGDVELFAMTYHPTYPTTEGYENWINYALSKNPNTRFALALPWGTNPCSTRIDRSAWSSMERSTTTGSCGASSRARATLSRRRPTARSSPISGRSMETASRPN